VSAQQPTTVRAGEAELIARIEALRPEFEAAEAARDARQREVQAARRPSEAVPLDTVQVGPMQIVSLPGESDVARDLFTAVWRERFPGAGASPSLRERTFAFQWRARLRRFYVEPSPDGHVIELHLSRVWAPTRARAEMVIAEAVAQALAADFPDATPVAEWLTYESNVADEAAYRLLAGSGSGATRECLTGDTPACMAALGFGLRDAVDRVAEWFPDEGRQAMVEQAGESGRVDRDEPAYRRCVEENDARACDPILAELDWVTNPPVSDRLRAHVLWYAAREGGENAWARALEAADAPVPEALARIADRPIDQLVAEWREYVVAARPDVHAGLGGRGTRVLLWSLIFVALAMRSTRWRLA
jgi:hypothetical protein